MESILQQKLNKASKWLLIIGLLLVVLGIAAIVYPDSFGKFSSSVIGVFLVIGGFMRMMFAGVSPNFGSMLLKWLFALLMVIAGVYIVANPDMGLKALTLVMGVYFLVDGVTTVFYSFSLRSFGSGSYLMLNGILGIVIGVLIFSKWPESSMYAVGIYVGVKLIIDGGALAITGYILRKTLGGTYLEESDGGSDN